MKKRLILVVLAAITLLASADDTFAFGMGSRGEQRHQRSSYSHSSGRPHYQRDGFRHSRGGFDHRRLGLGRYERRWSMVSPRHRIGISPTIIFSSSNTTVVEETVVVWVTNYDGSKTEVKLTMAEDGGYIGPKGEYYSTMPTEEQLKALYGVDCPPARNNVVIWFNNSDGSETVVVLTKDGSEYVGPKGERYQTMPTMEQLKEIYGK